MPAASPGESSTRFVASGLLPGRLAFTTGTRPELWVVNPALLSGLGYLIYRAVLMGVIKIRL